MKLNFSIVLLLIVVASLPVSVGCSDSKSVESEVTTGGATAHQTGPTQIASGVSSSRERAAVVPGTVVSRAIDDPSRDGWATEAIAMSVGEQLGHLLHALDGDDQTDSYARLVGTDDAVCNVFKIGMSQVTYEHGGLVVRRADLPDGGGEQLSLSDGIKRLLLNLETVSGVRSKVKIFRVDVSEGLDEIVHENATCSAYLQIFGESADGHFQVNATADCDWRLPSRAAPRLRQITIRRWDQVVSRANAPDEGGRQSDAKDTIPMFSDCTAAVMKDDEVFRRQLLPGVDHWLGTIESRLGIDIGGWQGISVADVNGDGLDDVYCSQPGGLPNRLYLQQPDGTCIENSREAGLDWLDSCHASLFVDLDNDGDQDAVIGLKDGVLILANDGHGTFEVRAQKILPAALPYSISAADFDNDSDLDLYVCCYNRRGGVNQHLLFARPVPYHDANNGGRNVLLVNEIDSSAAAEWSFRYSTRRVGLDENNRRFSYASAWEDYDNDGDMDLYVANDFGRNNLYQNDGGRFRDVATEAGVEDVSPGMSACWGDFNNDGFVDLYVSNMFSSVGNRIAFQDEFLKTASGSTRAEFQRHARGNSLFQNAGDGTFRDVSDVANVTLGRWAWGSRFADLNNDGWQDLIVTNGFITQPDTGDL